MSEQLNAAIREMNEAFAEFRSANDERIARLEKGFDDGVLNDRVEKINQRMTDITARIGEIQEIEARVEQVENVIARPGGRGVAANDEQAMLHARQFQALLRGVPLNTVPASTEALDQFAGYKNGMLAYFREGPEKMPADIRNELSVGFDGDGGYLVTPDMSGRIVDFVRETSPMRQYAAVQVISTDALQGDYDLDEATSGGWVGERDSRTETGTPGIGQWKIEVHEQYAEPRATQQLLDDAAIDIESWLTGKIASKFARTENTGFVSGTGVGQPRGFLTYTAGTPTASAFNVIEQVVSGANGAFAASAPGDKLIDMMMAVKGPLRMGAVWACARLTIAALRKLMDGDGNYLWQPDFTQALNGSLLGHPVVEFNDMPALATNSLSLAFANFREAYQIVDRMGMRILRDPYTTKGRVKFYATKRTGGDVVNFEAIKLMKFST